MNMMNSIDARGLAHLLKAGFQGEIRFRGTVKGITSEVDMAEPVGRFYESTGEFRLVAPVQGRRGYALENMANDGGSKFYFGIRSGEDVNYSCEDWPADVSMHSVRIPITLGEKAFLCITNPNNILY